VAPPNARSLSRSPSSPPPPFTQSPFPPTPRSLEREGQTSLQKPRLVVSHRLMMATPWCLDYDCRQYDQTNPRPRATTTRDDLDHGDAARLHCKHDCPSFCSSRPFYLVHARLVSPQNMPLIKSLGPIRASITRILVLRYRMYPYTVRNPCHEPIV
jgi:hypothetical protein